MSIFGGISSDEMYRIFLRLSQAHKSGIGSFTITGKLAKSENKAVSKVFSTILKDISSGVPLSDAFGKHKCFPDFCQYVIHIGEQSNSLPACFKLMAQSIRQSKKIRKKIFSAALPLFIGLPFVAIAFSIFSIFIVPLLQQLYDSLNLSLPQSTVAFINFSIFLSENWIFILMSLAIAIYMLLIYLKRHPETIDSILLNIPFYGTIHHDFLQYKFCAFFQLLISVGMDSVTALEKCADAVGSARMGKVLKDAAQMIKSTGLPLGQALQESNKSKILDSNIIDLLGDGISSELKETIEDEKVLWQSNIDSKSEDLGEKISPFFILFAFSFIVYFVLTILDPMLNLNRGM